MSERKTKRLSQVADILTGFPFTSENFKEDGEGHFLVRGSNVKRGNLDWDSKIARFWPSDEFKPEHERYLLEEGDIVVAMDGALIGKSYSVVQSKDLPALLVQRVARIRGKDPEDTAFIYHSIASEKFARYVDSRRTQTAIPHISLGDIREFSIWFPSADLRKSIGKLFSTIDTRTQQIEKLIAAKTERKRGLMQQLLTGDRRFSEFVKSDEKHKTACGVLPRDWPMAQLSDVFQVVQRRNKGATKRVLTASGQLGMVDQRTYFNRSVSGASIAKYYLLERGEFAYNRSSMNGYPFGAIKRLNVHDKGAVSTLYLCFALNHPDCDSDFWMHFFEGGLLNGQLRGIAQMGARSHGLLNVTNSDFFAASVPMPALEEQRRIADVLDAATREIDLLKEQLDALKTQKRGLMQELLSGEVLVTAAAATATAGNQ